MILLESNMDYTNVVESEVIMVNKNEEVKHAKKTLNYYDYPPKNNVGLITCRSSIEFYRKDLLMRDGFLHPDGSLRFKFSVKKQNYSKLNELYKEDLEKNLKISHDKLERFKCLTKELLKVKYRSEHKSSQKIDKSNISSSVSSIKTL